MRLYRDAWGGGGRRITQLEQKPATHNDRVVNGTLLFKRTSI